MNDLIFTKWERLTEYEKLTNVATWDLKLVSIFEYKASLFLTTYLTNRLSYTQYHFLTCFLFLSE